jgi:glycosyltransferase involved in cell wall biosynthesis
MMDSSFAGRNAPVPDPNEKPLRLLRVVCSANPSSGGTIEAVRVSGREMELLGHSVEVVCLDRADDPWIEEFPLKCYALGGKGGYRYSSELVGWIQARISNYDCVIVEGIWQYHSLGTWRALRNSRLPYVVFTHGMLDPWFKRQFPLKHLKKWLYWPWAEYRVLRDARAVLFTCDEERRLARQSFWIYEAREAVATIGTPGVPEAGKDYAGIFLDKFPDLRPFRRFVFLGRVHPKKGPDILLETLARLQATGRWDPGTMRLVMAGPADGAYAGELQALAKKLGIEKSVVWTGMLLGDDKWGALQAAEAFLLPSHQENFGIAVAESLSVGVPVLISRSVNIWADIVADGGGLADEDTVAGCERLWLRWLEMSEGERAAMGRAARACFEARYTSRRAAISLLSNIYQVMHAERSAALAAERAPA